MIFDKHYEPFYLEDLKKGMYIDFLERFENAYPEFKIIKRTLPRKRLDIWMKTGEAHAFSLNSPMFAKSDDYLFTDPIWTTGDYVVSLKNDMVAYKKPEDLFEVTAGIIDGNGYGLLDAHIQSGKIRTQAVPDYDSLYLILMNKRVPCILANKHMTLYGMKKMGIDCSKFMLSKIPIYEFTLAPMVQKSCTNFVAKMNAFIKASNENGFLEEINSKYLK